MPAGDSGALEVGQGNTTPTRIFTGQQSVSKILIGILRAVDVIRMALPWNGTASSTRGVNAEMVEKRAADGVSGVRRTGSSGGDCHQNWQSGAAAVP